MCECEHVPPSFETIFWTAFIISSALIVFWCIALIIKMIKGRERVPRADAVSNPTCESARASYIVFLRSMLDYQHVY